MLYAYILVDIYVVRNYKACGGKDKMIIEPKSQEFVGLQIINAHKRFPLKSDLNRTNRL